MAIVVNLDVVMAKKKMGVTELAKEVDITMANLSILKNSFSFAFKMTIYKRAFIIPTALILIL